MPDTSRATQALQFDPRAFVARAGQVRPHSFKGFATRKDLDSADSMPSREGWLILGYGVSLTAGCTLQIDSHILSSTHSASQFLPMPTLTRQGG
jgi:hypothetical protein